MSVHIPLQNVYSSLRLVLNPACRAVDSRDFLWEMFLCLGFLSCTYTADVFEPGCGFLWGKRFHHRLNF